MNPAAVIFDMDGLLMDSERVGLHVMHACGLRQRCNIPIEMVQETVGANRQFSSDLYRRHFPSLDTELLFRDFRENMCQLAREGKIPLKKGAKELLVELKRRGVPRAVASSSGLTTIETYLTCAGIRQDFDAVITGNGLPSKPAPDVFLRAAEALLAAPEGCLVREDSINGVKAGRAAGMRVCMVPDLFPFTEELAPYCDHAVPDLAAVIPLLNP